MKLGKKILFKSQKVFLLRADPLYEVEYNYIIKVINLGDGYYMTTLNRLVQNNLKEWTFRKEEVILKQVKKLNDRIIILDVVNKDLIYALDKQ